MNHNPWREQFEEIIKIASEGILILNRDSVIIYANKPAQDLLGFDLSFLLGHSFPDTVWRICTLEGEPYPEEERPFRRVIETGVVIYGLKCILELPNHKRITVSANATPLPSKEGEIEAVAIAFTDVTKVMQAAEEIRESRREVLDILESISDGFFALDNLWRFTYVNRKAEELLGRRKEALLFRNIWEAFPEAVGTKFYKEFNRAKEEMVPVSLEEFYPPLNKWFEVHIYPYESGLSGYFSDVTERKRAEETLREINQTLQALVKASPLAIIALDPGGNVKMWNPAAERIFGWSEQEVLGHPLPGIPEDKQEMSRKARARILQGETIAGDEVQRCRKDGSLVDVSISAAPLYDAAGRINGIMSIVADITERRK